MSPSVPISPSFLVARYLRSNDYNQSLETFIKEAGLPKDAGSATGDESDSWTIEQTLTEKSAFDKSLKFERAGDGGEEGDLRWTVPAPSTPAIVEIPNPSNVLSVSVEPLDVIVDARGGSTTIPPRLLATDATRRMNAFEVNDGYPLAKSISTLADSPIISHASLLDGKYLLTTCTSGQLNLSRGEEIIDRRKDHAKFAVKVVTYQEEGEEQRIWVATAGWDMNIFLYSIIPSSEDPSLGEPVAHIKLKTLPESIIFVRNPDTGDLILLVSRSDSSMIYYYQVEPPATSPPTETQQPYDLPLLGTQNLAPGSNAWVAFSPSSLATSPRDPNLLAVATSSLSQFMKLMIVRLLFPANARTQPPAIEPETQAIQAMDALTIQNREDAAILISASTLSPQSNYSNPQVVWRPDGSGVWVNGDDGVIRGVEAKTGKVIASLKDGHEFGSKVRTIWAGWVDVEGGKREEWVVSGGFDKRLIVWKVHDDE